MINMIDCTRCSICGKDTYTDMITKQWVEEKGYIMFVCRNCLLTGQFEREVDKMRNGY